MFEFVQKNNINYVAHIETFYRFDKNVKKDINKN